MRHTGWLDGLTLAAGKADYADAYLIGKKFMEGVSVEKGKESCIKTQGKEETCRSAIDAGTLGKRCKTNRCIQGEINP